MSFLTGTFLFAMVAAAGPTIIHLLNRRRHRTINWAAMDFLREAVRRNKKLVELRDIILLLVRTLAIALFVLAMAQPFVRSQSTWWVVVAAFVAVLAGIGTMIFGQQAQKSGPMYSGGTLLALGIGLFVYAAAQSDESNIAAYSGEPVHAVIVIDNSLSMGYVELDKSLLDVAKDKAKAFITTLPRGSDVTVIPLCGQDEWHLRSVDSTQEDALDTVDQVQLVDRAARAADGAAAARDAIRDASHILTKRIVFLSDMQRDTWSPDAVGPLLDELTRKHGVQIVQVVPGKSAATSRRGNSWVADFRLRDGVADAQSPAIFLATLRHMGDESAPRVRVSLKINDVVVEEQHVDLQPGQMQRLTFKHKFDSAGSSGEPLFVRARLEIDAKEPLSLDNFREIIVPIVAQVPVLFVDQYGEREMPRQGRYGETFLLRRIMTHRAPQQSAADKPLVEVRLRSAESVAKEDLKDARLAVVAGLTSPPPELVQVLREFVEQGGQLFLAAGAEFDPRAWNTIAWRDGAGILPAPLRPEPIGKTPSATLTAGTQEPATFRLAPASMRGEAVDLDMDPAEQREIFASPYFYKAVSVDTGAVEEFVKAEKGRIEERRKLLGEHEIAERDWAQLERSGKLTPQEAARREAARAKVESLSPRWLGWTNPLAMDDSGKTVDELVIQSRPRVLGTYDNNEVFAIRRDVGKGRIVMITTGCHPQWNTMAIDHSVLIFDQVLLSMLTRSLPDRTYGPVPVIPVRIDPRDQAARFEVLAPGDKEALPVPVDRLGGNTYGLRLTAIGKRGTYELRRLGLKSDDATVNREWKMLFAVNGSSEESELISYTQAEFAEAMALPKVRWVPLDGEISLEGEAYIGHQLWKMLLWGAIICLAIEMVFLAIPYLIVKEETQSA
jgi:hypothetical protein